ncbi:MAG: hypothetical protein EXS15_07630 [Phycisphaerales bacterium]|nr:hypothetical protein [Phycisphaerales bacterium]
MKKLAHPSCSALLMMTCVALLSIASMGCDEGDDDTTRPATKGPGQTPPNHGSAPPVITVDLVKITSQLGAGFQGQADALDKMASGKSMSAAESTTYFEAQRTVAVVSKDISDMLQKNPRWQRATTEALEKNAKPGIIALYHAEKAMKKAKQSGKAGSPSGACPADIKKLLGDNDLIITRIRGLMPYSKAEMESPSSKGGSSASPPSKTPAQTPAQTPTKPPATTP